MRSFDVSAGCVTNRTRSIPADGDDFPAIKCVFATWDSLLFDFHDARHIFMLEILAIGSYRPIAEFLAAPDRQREFLASPDRQREFLAAPDRQRDVRAGNGANRTYLKYQQMVLSSLPCIYAFHAWDSFSFVSYAS